MSCRVHPRSTRFAIETFAYNFNTVLALLAKNALGLGADGFGSLLSAQGLGYLAAALGHRAVALLRPARLPSK